MVSRSPRRDGPRQLQRQGVRPNHGHPGAGRTARRSRPQGGLMEIQIDSAELEKAINENATAAVVSAMSGYEIRKAIAEKLTQEVADGAIARGLEAAIAQVDTEQIVTALAR